MATKPPDPTEGFERTNELRGRQIEIVRPDGNKEVTFYIEQKWINPKTGESKWLRLPLELS